MDPKYLLVVAATLIFGCEGKGTTYNLIVRQMGDCEETGTNEFQLVGNKLRRYNRTTHTYSGILVIPRLVDDNYKLTIITAYYGNGGWKSANQGFDFGGVCHMLKTYASRLIKSVLGKSGIPPPYCPIPPGNYTVTDMNYMLDVDIPYIPYGRFRVDFAFMYKDGTKLGCKRIFIDSEPKKKIYG